MVPGHQQAGPAAQFWVRPRLAHDGVVGSCLWSTQAVPVSFTLAPGVPMEKLLDEALGLFLHCRFGAGVHKE